MVEKIANAFYTKWCSFRIHHYWWKVSEMVFIPNNEFLIKSTSIRENCHKYFFVTISTHKSEFKKITINGESFATSLIFTISVLLVQLTV